MAPNYGLRPCLGKPSIRYYFSTLTQACEKITFSGCGNDAGNNFKTMHECKNFCAASACDGGQTVVTDGEPPLPVSCSSTQFGQDIQCPGGSSCRNNRLFGRNFCCMDGSYDVTEESGKATTVTDIGTTGQWTTPTPTTTTPITDWTANATLGPWYTKPPTFPTPSTVTTWTPEGRSKGSTRHTSTTITRWTKPSTTPNLGPGTENLTDLCPHGAPEVTAEGDVAYCESDSYCPLTHMCLENVCCERSPGVCREPIIRGICRKRILRYAYNADRQECEKFYYSGCGGNTNNFETNFECEDRCRQDIPHTLKCPSGMTSTSNFILDNFIPCSSNRSCPISYFCHVHNGVGGCCPSREQVCAELYDMGTRCPAASSLEKPEIRWYFNNIIEECQSFEFFGCGGNNNRFLTKENCEDYCSIMKTSVDPIIDGTTPIVELSSQIHSNPTTPTPVDLPPEQPRSPWTTLFSRPRTASTATKHRWSTNFHTLTFPPGATSDYSSTFPTTSASTTVTAKRDNDSDTSHERTFRARFTTKYPAEVVGGGVDNNVIEISGGEPVVGRNIPFLPPKPRADVVCLRGEPLQTYDGARNVTCSTNLDCPKSHYCTQNMCCPRKPSAKCLQGEALLSPDNGFLYCQGPSSDTVASCPPGFECYYDGEVWGCCPEKNTICSSPMDIGHGCPRRQKENHWYFNKDVGLCEPFMHEGCGGNDNNFLNPAECEIFCGRSKGCPFGGLPETSDKGNAVKCLSSRDCSRNFKCEQVVDHQGTQGYCCPTREHICATDVRENTRCGLEPVNRFFYNQRNGACQTFHYYGCDLHGNNFGTLAQCGDFCSASGFDENVIFSWNLSEEFNGSISSIGADDQILPTSGHYRYIIYGVLVPVVCFCGMLASATVLRRFVGKSTMNVCLRWLFASEFIKLGATCLLLPPMALCRSRSAICSTWNRAAPYLFTVGSSFHVLSLIVCDVIALERLHAVASPFKSLRMSRRNVVKILVFSTLLSIVYGIPRTFEMEVDSMCACLVETYTRSSLAYIWAYRFLCQCILAFCAPFAVAVLVNMLLIRRLLFYRTCLVQQCKTTKGMRRITESCISASCVISMFLLSNTLYGACTITELVYSLCRWQLPERFDMAVYIGNFLVITTPFSNCLIYSGLGTRMCKNLSSKIVAKVAHAHLPRESCPGGECGTLFPLTLMPTTPLTTD